MLNISIRTETAEDVAAIDAVTIAAFLHAPHTDHTEQFIVKALRAVGELTVSLVAECDGAVVGHVAVSPVTISNAASNGSAGNSTDFNSATGWFGLGPISVLPDYQGNGIGSRLMREALHRLKAAGAAGCVLLGDPAYYHRFGFRAEPDLVLPGVPAEYFQALSLGGELPRGVVTYSTAFEAKE